MALSPYVYDATAENFPRLVLENSQRGLVLVHFWTPKAGPCMILMPRLVKLASEYGGKFLLVMLNTDELGALARRLGVTSVPTVKFFRRGEVVETVHGAESDNHFRQLLDRFIMRDSVNLYAQGLAAWQRRQTGEARRMLAAAAVEEPGNPVIPRDLAKLLWADGEHDQAMQLLESLPAELRAHADIARLYAHFALASAAEHAPADVEARAADAGNADARFQLAALQLAKDDLESALGALDALDAEHPQYRQGLPRQALLALFDLLGPEHPLTREYRARLSQRLS
ncbi:tetratricopeptide repeat protein [Betaproteobacteria bacterium SCN2]|jgi:putative thioredoxin|nr:tetratricopeptide repeat protein [Betaproteobacteria bacterium SCN2]